MPSIDPSALERLAPTEPPVPRCTSTYIAFVEALQEWAELPADGPDAAYWGAAMTHEMSVGMWSGCHVRILLADSVLYPVLLGTRGSASLWRDRTAEVGERARELRRSSSRELRVRARGSQTGMTRLEPVAAAATGDDEPREP